MLFTLAYLILLAIPYGALLSCKYALCEEEDLLHFFNSADTWKKSSWKLLELYKEKLPDRLACTKDADKIPVGLQAVSAVTHTLAFLLCLIAVSPEVISTAVLALAALIHAVFFHWLTRRNKSDLSTKAEEYKGILSDIENVIDDKKPLWHKHDWLQDVERGDLLHLRIVTNAYLSNASGETVTDFTLKYDRIVKAYDFPAFFLGVEEDPYVNVLVVGSPFENDEIYELRDSRGIESIRRHRYGYNDALIFTVNADYLCLFTAEEFAEPEVAIEKSRLLKSEMSKPLSKRSVLFGFDSEMLQNLKLDEDLRSEYAERERKHYNTRLAEANDETTPAEEKRQAFYREKHRLIPKAPM